MIYIHSATSCLWKRSLRKAGSLAALQRPRHLGEGERTMAGSTGLAHDRDLLTFYINACLPWRTGLHRAWQEGKHHMAEARTTPGQYEVAELRAT